MGKKPKTNAEILAWEKDIIKMYACLNVPKQQMEAMQQGICTEKYGIKIVRHYLQVKLISKQHKYFSNPLWICF